MGRKEDNIKIRTIIKTLLSLGKTMTAVEICKFIVLNDFKIVSNLNTKRIHTVIKKDKLQNGMLRNVEFEMKKNTKYFYIPAEKRNKK